MPRVGADSRSFGKPVIPAPTRSRANLANQAPVGTTIADLKTSGGGKETGQKPGEKRGEPDQGRRRGDAPWIPVQVVLNVGDRTEGASSDRVVAGVPAKPRRPWRTAAVVAGSLVLAALASFFWPLAREALENRNSPVSVSSAPQPARAGGAAHPRIELPADPDAALTTALDHLNTALEEMPGRSPEQILRTVSSRKQDCMLAWTSNLPSLIFGGEPLRPNSLAYTLENCAESVSRMHDALIEPEKNVHR